MHRTIGASLQAIVAGRRIAIHLSGCKARSRLRQGRRRLLIMNGHGSHITVGFISFCMDNAIDLLILPPHWSHVLQPLDVGVFSPLKRALAAGTDAVSRLDSGRLKRVEWTEMYIRARHRAMIRIYHQEWLAGYRSGTSDSYRSAQQDSTAKVRKSHTSYPRLP